MPRPRLVLRFSRQRLARIDAAAARVGKTRRRFVVDAVVDAARRVILVACRDGRISRSETVLVLGMRDEAELDEALGSLSREA